MIRRGLALLVALALSGAPAALQMCGSHCVTAVSCHDAARTDAQSAVKAGPQLCPHAVALGAVIGTKSAPPKSAVSLDAPGNVANHLYTLSDISMGVLSIDRLASASTHHAAVQQLRI